MKKILTINLLLASLLVLSFDVVAFHFLPFEYAVRFPEYRSTKRPEGGGRMAYPKGYFVPHETRGFDIGKGKRGEHWVDGITYPIWSNSLGCFDREHSNIDQYVYFAGDSFTWGYSPFNKKFGTIVEERTGTQILKCGVTHTGQRHQFEKLADIVTETGKPPKAIFVFYSPNDVANDYAHPHTTVIQGWQVDTVSLDENNEIVRHSHMDLEKRVQLRLRLLASEMERNLWWASIKYHLKSYSLSMNIINDIAVSRIYELTKRKSNDARIYSLIQQKENKY